MVAPVGALSGYCMGLEFAALADSSSLPHWDRVMLYVWCSVVGATVVAAIISLIGILIMTPIYAIERAWDQLRGRKQFFCECEDETSNLKIRCERAAASGAVTRGPSKNVG